jgi:hypothetical protein
VTPRRYPLGPLFELTGWSMNRVSEIAPTGGPEYRRRRVEGVTELVADRLAVAAGLHAWLVWPEMADHAICDAQRECAADECEEQFVPADPRQRFCSPRCVKRMYARRRRAKNKDDGTYARDYYQQHRDGILRQRRRDYWVDPDKHRERKRAERRANATGPDEKVAA